MTSFLILTTLTQQFADKLSYSHSSCRLVNLWFSHLGNSLDQLRHPRSDAYSAEQVILNKQQIWCGRAYLDCYRHLAESDFFNVTEIIH